MALDPRYQTAPSLQEYFVDKDSGLPLAGGKVFFYHDSGNRDIPKPVFELQGNSANYTYAPLPNPIILSAVGTMQDNNGNDIIPYYFPFDVDGNIDLYYIVVQSSLGVPQFTRSAWPNPTEGQIEPAADTFVNYIPNGQFLNHTDLPNNTTPPFLLQPGTNILAQGGWSFELTNPPPAGQASVNTAFFVEAAFPIGIPQSPRYVVEIVCSSVNPLDTTKRLRIKWFDVYKFSFGSPTYTFAFSASPTAPLPITINLYQFFGTNGTPFIDAPVEVATLIPGETAIAYQFAITFPSEDTSFIDKVNNNDFIAIDIVLPTTQTFDVQFTDFILTPGTVVVNSFPIETNADMMTRSVMGWADTVDPTGMDLYLPPILTRQGMTWDLSQVGQVGMNVLPIASPTSLPAPQHNMMPCDGSSYITSDVASNGIPFQRLFNYLINTPYNNGLPLYGTGLNYDSAVFPFSGANNDTFRITWNAAGAGSPQAVDGGNPTGFVFSPMYIYNGSITGIDSFGLFSSNVSANTVLLTTIMDGAEFNNPNFNNTGFTGSDQSDFMQGFVNNINGLLAFQKSAWFITTVSGAALVKAGTGRYMTFWTAGNTQQYYMWFNVDGTNTDPAGPGNPIEVNISATYSAQDVADLIREVFNAFQSTNIMVIPGALNNKYFTFNSNPGGLRDFFVWYTNDPNASAPAVTGIGIRVLLPTSPTPDANTIRNLTCQAINAYQFQAPDFRGMFFRAADPNSTWDFDAINRWSSVSSVSGPGPGTFEYGQFLSHYHSQLLRTSGGIQGGWFEGSLLPGSAQNTFTSGGSETRPVNTYIYPFIRY
jgi:hypothetical protein